MDDKFITALSEKDGNEAIKEVSLKIKSIFTGSVKMILIFLTPHYQPAMLLETLNLTLNPQFVLGLQAPFLIFEDRIIEKGIIGLCIRKETVSVKDFFIKRTEPDAIESALRKSLKTFSVEKQFFFASISQQFNPYDCLRSFTLSLGLAFNVFGSGFIKRYASLNYQIINGTIDEGLVSVFGKGIDIDICRIGGFVALGKPFILTQVISKQGIVREINNQRAMSIYEHYLGERIDIFRKNRLFALYPLIIMNGEESHLVSVIDCLDDGSLVCVGDVKESLTGHIAMFHPPTLFQSIKKELDQKKTSTLLFIINSLIRKKILKDYAHEEVKAIKRELPEACKVIGIYSDYSFFPERISRDVITEAGTPLLTFWQ